MKIGTIITLTDIEVRIVKHVAKRRRDDNIKQKTNNARISNQDDLKINVEGFAGEMAFCKLFNVYPDLTSECRTSSEDSGEAVINNKQIDIKTTKYDDGLLLAPIWSNNKKVDIYALMTGTIPTYCFRGFILKEDLIVKHMKRDLGYGDTYGAAQNQLVEFEALII